MAGENADKGDGNDNVPDQDTDTGTAEFDAEFDRLASGSGPASPAQPDDDDDAGDQGAQPQGDEPPAPNSPSGDEPQGDTPNSSDDDPWKDADPRYRQLYEARERELQARLTQQGREISQLRTQGTQPPATAKKETPDGEEAKADDPFSSEDIKKLEEDYGEVAGPILNLLKQQREQIERLSQPVQNLTEQRSRDAEERNMQELNTLAPDWTNLVQHEKFQGWVQSQPRAVVETIQRNWDQIVDPTEAAWAFNQFRQSLGTEQPRSAEADKTDRSRERRLNAGKDSGGRGGAPVKTGIPDDFDGAFDAMVAQKERQNKR